MEKKTYTQTRFTNMQDIESEISWQIQIVYSRNARFVYCEGCLFLPKDI
jgi:hypothetical protein